MSAKSREASDGRQAIHFLDLFAGLGIGLLVGVILGLSLSAVVGTVIGALTALLAAFLGLSDKPLAKSGEGAEAPTSLRRRDARIGAFGIACTLGVLLGLFLRTHDLLALPMKDRVQRWIDAGYEPRQARQLVTFEETGLVPEGWAGGTESDGGDPGVPATRAAARVTALYGAEARACTDLDPRRFADTAELLYAWQLERGAWEELAREIADTVPAGERGALAEAAWKLACDARR
jgi:hypothetical protein